MIISVRRVARRQFHPLIPVIRNSLARCPAHIASVQFPKQFCRHTFSLAAAIFHRRPARAAAKLVWAITELPNRDLVQCLFQSLKTLRRPSDFPARPSAPRQFPEWVVLLSGSNLSRRAVLLGASIKEDSASLVWDEAVRSLDRKSINRI